MEQNGYAELSGIERELVLQYLIDGNVPVTLTPSDKITINKNDYTKTEPVIKSLWINIQVLISQKFCICLLRNRSRNIQLFPPASL